MPALSRLTTNPDDILKRLTIRHWDAGLGKPIKNEVFQQALTIFNFHYSTWKSLRGDSQAPHYWLYFEKLEECICRTLAAGFRLKAASSGSKNTAQLRKIADHYDSVAKNVLENKFSDILLAFRQCHTPSRFLNSFIDLRDGTVKGHLEFRKEEEARYKKEVSWVMRMGGRKTGKFLVDLRVFVRLLDICATLTKESLSPRLPSIYIFHRGKLNDIR
jgi:hypothetical protein